MQVIEQNNIDNMKENNINVPDVNRQLEHMRSRRKVAKKLGISKFKLNKIMKENNHSYNRKIKQFILNKKGAIALNRQSMIVDESNNIDINMNDEMKYKLADIIHKYERINTMLEHYESDMNSNNQNNVIEVEYKLVADFIGKYKRTTVEINENIWNEFSDVCKEKHKHLDKRDLISIALRDFIKKY